MNSKHEKYIEYCLKEHSTENKWETREIVRYRAKWECEAWYGGSIDREGYVAQQSWYKKWYAV